MKALLVDDDATSRCLLRLALARHFEWEIVEANDGMQALRELEQQDVDVVFLDVHMPNMDGIEMLEVLRASPKHAALPVIMLTNEKDADMVRQVVALGVDDYLVKPLSAARIGERVTRAIAQHAARPQASAAASPTMGWLGSGPALLVDSDADFREFFKATFEPHGTVLTAATGVEAMRLCTEFSPQAILIGSAVGLLTPPLLVKRLRANGLAQRMSIFMVTTESERAQWGDIDGVAGYLTKSFVADALVSQLERAFGKTGAAIEADYRDTLLRAIEQAFGMMLSVDVETIAPPIESPGEGLTAAVELTGAGETRIVSLQCSTASARNIAAAFRSLDADAVADADIHASLGELIDIVAGRVLHTMRERGLSVQAARPEVRPTALHGTDLAAAVFLRAGGATLGVGLSASTRPAGLAN